MRIAILAAISGAVLFAAGAAVAGLDLRKVVLKPGHCVRVAKVSVCAAKAKPPIRVTGPTVTSPAVTTTTPAPPPITVTTPAPPPVTVASPPVTVTVITTATPKVAFSAGTYRVNTDIQAGTYQSVTVYGGCYWARLSGFGGTLDEIIANFFGSSPTIVTISATDAGFHSESCGGWSKIG
jgi:hypothetical protein